MSTTPSKSILETRYAYAIKTESFEFEKTEALDKYQNSSVTHRDDFFHALREYNKIRYDKVHSTPKNCYENQEKCKKGPFTKILFPTSRKLTPQLHDETTHTNLSLTRITKQSNDDFTISMFSTYQKPRPYGNDFITTFSKSENIQVVSHEIIDHFNGTFTVRKKCRVESDENFKIFFRIEKTAEQIHFLDIYNRAYRPSGMAYRVNYNETFPNIMCSTLPWKKTFHNFSINYKTLWCDIDPNLVDLEQFYWSKITREVHYSLGEYF